MLETDNIKKGGYSPFLLFFYKNKNEKISKNKLYKKTKKKYSFKKEKNR